MSEPMHAVLRQYATRAPVTLPDKGTPSYEHQVPEAVVGRESSVDK